MKMESDYEKTVAWCRANSFPIKYSSSNQNFFEVCFFGPYGSSGEIKQHAGGSLEAVLRDRWCQVTWDLVDPEDWVKAKDFLIGVGTPTLGIYQKIKETEEWAKSEGLRIVDGFVGAGNEDRCSGSIYGPCWWKFVLTGANRIREAVVEHYEDNIVVYLLPSEDDVSGEGWRDRVLANLKG